MFQHAGRSREAHTPYHEHVYSMCALQSLRVYGESSEMQIKFTPLSTSKLLMAQRIPPEVSRGALAQIV